MTTHPSHLALDLVALGGDAPSDVVRHLESCPACAATVAARRTCEPLPAWAEPLHAAPAPRPRPLSSTVWHRLRWWLLPLPVAAALAAAVVLVRPIPQAGPAGDSIREKGLPAVAVYVKRGDEVATWDGHTPVQPGDRLRLGIRGGGFAQLSVASLQPGGVPVVLYAGPLEPRGETLLPLSFRVDAAGSAEDLSIILSPRPVAPAAHTQAAGQPVPPGAWTARLHLPKEATR